MRTRLARRKSFQCMHRYALEDQSDAQNRAIFGACFSPSGHGHNYEVEAFFEGTVDSRTGMVMNLSDVDRLLEDAIAPIAGKHLNFEVDEFKALVPTTENIALYIVNRIHLGALFPQVQLVKLRLYECEDLWVDVWP